MQQPRIPEEVLQPLYPSVGALVLNWSILEQALELWVALIFHSWEGGKRLQLRRIPFQFSAKVDFLRRAFKELDDLQEYSTPALTFIESADELAEIRDALVHGALSAYDPPPSFSRSIVCQSIAKKCCR